MWMTRLLDRILPADAGEGDPIEAVRLRAATGLAVLLLLVTVLSTVGRVAATGSMLASEWMLMGMSIVTWLAVLVVLRRWRALTWGGLMVMGPALLQVAFGAYMQGGLSSPMMVWLVPLPMVGALLFGARTALVSLVTGLLTMGVLFSLTVAGIDFQTPFSDPMSQNAHRLWMYAGALTLVGMVAVAYEVLVVGRTRAQHQTELTLRAIIDALEVGVVVLREGEVVFSNPAGERMLQAEPIDSEGPLSDQLAGRIASHGPVHLVAACTQDGVCYLRLDTREMSFGGEPAKVVTLLDETHTRSAEHERLALNNRLQEAQRLESVGLLAGGVAHDFNNLLTPVLVNSHLLSEDEELEEDQREAVDEIRTAAEHASSLVGQLLAYAGRSPVASESVELLPLLQSVLRLVRTGMRLDASTTLDCLLFEPVQADATQLRQVVANLVTNALQATGSGGTVLVSCLADVVTSEEIDALHRETELVPGPCVRIEVTDDGPGIPPEVLLRIFDPFFTTKDEGRGLGLAAVRGIVRRMGGALYVQTEVGCGTTFGVLLPLVYATDAVPAELGEAASTTGSVVVIDDEPMVATQVGRLMRRWGWDVRIANTGEDGLALVAERCPDLVIVDFLMPGLTGADVLARIRQTQPELPVVLCTGYAAPLQEAGGSGFDAVVFKPFAPKTLQRAVHAATLGEVA